LVFDKSEEKLHAPEDINTFEGQTKVKAAMSQNRVDALKKRSSRLVHMLVQA
jgi:Holliday junction resolvasome RuvABC ATP-dependent DNA helicase subunit